MSGDLTFFYGLLLGVVQGIAEWLPVSSEGINSLILVGLFGMGLSEAVSLALWLHLGTLLAAVLYFRSDLRDLCRELPEYIGSALHGRPERRDPVLSFLILATLVSVAVGAPLLLLGLEQLELRGDLAMAVVGALLIATGLFQKLAHSRIGHEPRAPGLKDSILIGVLQGLAALPGLSRSGLTVSGLLLRGYSGEQALRLSFLLSIPVVLVAAIGLAVLERVALAPAMLGGLLGSLVLGFLTIKALMKLAFRIPFWCFCLLFGLLSLVPLLTA